MYVSPNFKTKKLLKEAVKNVQGGIGFDVTVYSPGPFVCPSDGEVAVEGPHYPEAHKWYARVLVKDGIVVKVLS